MTVFDLLFLVAALSSFSVLIGVIILAARGQFHRAGRLLRTYALAAVAYVGVGVIVSLAVPQRVIARGVPWCFDDWCLTAERVTRTPDGAMALYRVDLQLSSRARRVTQRANGAWLFLIDGSGRRFAPQADSSAMRLDVLLQPGESVSTSRVFRVPSDARQLGLITGHGGDYCGVMSFLVIGQSGCLFHKAAMIRID
jgi:hypothetical protein